MPMYILRMPCPIFVIVFWCLLVHRSHTLFCMSMYLQNLVSGVLSLHHVSFTWVCKVRALHLCKATPNVLKHILAPANLQVATIQLTYWSITTPISYRRYTQPHPCNTQLSHSNACLGSTVWIKSGSVVVTRFQCCYAFLFPLPKTTLGNKAWISLVSHCQTNTRQALIDTVN